MDFAPEPSQLDSLLFLGFENNAEHGRWVLVNHFVLMTIASIYKFTLEVVRTHSLSEGKYSSVSRMGSWE